MVDLGVTELKSLSSRNMSEELEKVSTDAPQLGVLPGYDSQQAVDRLMDAIFDDELFTAELLQLMNSPDINLPEVLARLREAAKDLPQHVGPVGECQIHFEEVSLSPPECCLYAVCHECVVTYVQTAVSERKLKIACINTNCTSFLSREEIRQKLDKHHKLQFDQFLVDENKDPHRKTCPRCNHITSDESFTSTADRRAVRRARKYGMKITCLCKQEWCFNCQAPYHEGMTCSQYRRGNKLVKNWASIYHDGQANAQKCPKCMIYIERNGGCDHMECTQCNTKFCYVCGGRRKVPFVLWPLLGDHESRLGAMGCCGNYLPDKPIRRRLARGAVLGAKIVATPVVLGVAAAAVPLAVGLLAAAIPIALVAAPVGYALYKIRRAIRTINHVRNEAEPERIPEIYFCPTSFETEINFSVRGLNNDIDSSPASAIAYCSRVTDHIQHRVLSNSDESSLNYDYFTWNVKYAGR